MRCASVSATMMTLPDAATATPEGPMKLAPAPVPSTEEYVPLPASVVTRPEVELSRRMRLLPASGSTMIPFEGITAIAAS